MRVGSLRWWFENRQTGEITIAQFPNWPLWGVAATGAVSVLVEADSALADPASWTRRGLWVYWAGDEIIRGVNPWRRLLGVLVLAWQAAAMLAG